MADFLASIMNFIHSTNVLEQIKEVDARGLFSNAWFLVPFIMLIGYWLYKMAINNLVILALSIGLWIFSGSPYAKGMIVNGELQIEKILPVAGVGIVTLGVLVYLFFIRSD
jgi:hypothetical protein